MTAFETHPDFSPTSIALVEGVAVVGGTSFPGRVWDANVPDPGRILLVPLAGGIPTEVWRGKGVRDLRAWRGGVVFRDGVFLGSGDRGAVVALDLGTSKTRRLDAPTSGDDTTVATLDVGTNGLYWSTTTAVRTDDGSTTYRHRLFHANEDEVVVELHGSEFDVVSGSESPSGFFFFDDEGRTSAIAFDGDGSGRLLALEQGSAETRELDDVGREASLGPYSSFLSIARRDRIFVGLKILTSGQRVLTTWSAPSVAQTSGFLTSLGEANLLPVVTESHVYWTQNGDRTTIRRSTFDARAPSASLVTVPYATDERREITVLTGGSRGLAWISMRSYSGDAAPYRLMTTIP